MIRLVVDTNVYISALVVGGRPAALLQLVEDFGLELVVSPEIAEELRATLASKFGWSTDRINEAQRGLWQRALWCTPPQIPRTSRDPDDEHILAAALIAQADLIVTGDTDLLVLRGAGKCQIITPAACLEMLHRLGL